MTNKIKCLFGYHEFTIPYESTRLDNPRRIGNMRMCSRCRRAATMLSATTGDTIWQLDENEQPISWESAYMSGKYMTDTWVAGMK